MVCTEYAVFHLNNDTTESTLRESKLYKESIDLVNSQPGCQKVYTGFGIEEKSKLIWIIEWKTFKDHKAFMDKKDIYKPFVDHLSSFSDKIDMFHYEFNPTLSSIWSTERPVIEQWTMFYKSGTSKEHELEAMKHFVDKCGDAVRATFEVSKEKEQTSLMLLSWKSVEEHMEWKQGFAGFRQALEKISALLEDKDMFHAKMTLW